MNGRKIMSDKLGFTFYPKDWWTSDTFFELDFTERYIFLECMFIMYQNDGVMKTQKTQFENRNRIKITDEQWENVTSKFLLVDGLFTLLSVNKRLRKAVTNRENGKSGGRPKKPKEPTSETQNNPPYESERESEEEIESKGEEKHSPSPIYSIKEFEKVEIAQNEFTMLACRRSGKSIDDVKILFSEFLKDQKAVNKIAWQNEPDAKTHFHNWIAKKKGSSSGRGLVH